MLPWKYSQNVYRHRSHAYNVTEKMSSIQPAYCSVVEKDALFKFSQWFYTIIVSTFHI